MHSLRFALDCKCTRVTLPCHIHLGGALKMITIENMHSSPSKVSDHDWIWRIILSKHTLKVAYDQPHDQQVSHKDIKYLTQAHNKVVQPK